ncbi:hypothetical protein [Amycolatopsis sp. NPDC004378]
MPTRERVLTIVEYLAGQVSVVRELGVFAHGSEELLHHESIGFALLGHEAGNQLLDFCAHLALFTRCLEDMAHRLPET